MAAIESEEKDMGETAEIQHLYSHVPWVFGDDHPVLRQVMSLGKRRNVEKDEVLLHEGVINDRLYIVDRGVLLASSRGVSNHLVPRWIACHGCLIGENTLFTRHPAVYRIKAVEASELVVFDQHEVVSKILPAFPQFSINLMESMAFKRFTTAVTQEHQHVATRVGLFLRLCALPLMQPRAAFITLTAPNIATLLGTSQSSVTKTVNLLSKSGIIDIDADGLITILDSDELDRFIDSSRALAKAVAGKKKTMAAGRSQRDRHTN